MEAAWKPTNSARGQALILEHCAALDRLGTTAPTARDRLQQVLGGELARFLLRALVGSHRPRSRDVVG